MLLMVRRMAVLVTGMSGVGKSTVLTELARLGYETVDTDDGGWIDVVEGELLWRETLIEELLDRPREAPLIVQGTVAHRSLVPRPRGTRAIPPCLSMPRTLLCAQPPSSREGQRSDSMRVAKSCVHSVR